MKKLMNWTCQFNGGPPIGYYLPMVYLNFFLFGQKVDGIKTGEQTTGKNPKAKINKAQSSLQQKLLRKLNGLAFLNLPLVLGS